jgi:hypothetical protein
MKYSVVAVTAFVAFTLVASNAFAEIDLDYLEATGGNGQVVISWGTYSEVDNRGFNIYRSDYVDGEYEQINLDLIPAEGGPAWRADYEYTDNDVVNGETYWYKLEDVDLYGPTTLHGPISATPQGPYPATANAEAATYGSNSLTGSGVFNEFILICIPIGAVIFLRILRRKR